MCYGRVFREKLNILIFKAEKLPVSKKPTKMLPLTYKCVIYITTYYHTSKYLNQLSLNINRVIYTDVDV